MLSPYFFSKLLPKFGTPLGIDVEMVKCTKTKKNIAAWVAISHSMQSTKYHRKQNLLSEEPCVYQAKIKHNLSEIDLMTRFSGITADMLRDGVPFERAQKDVQYFLENYKIVGANVISDLNSLGLERYINTCVDIQYDDGYYRGSNGPRDAIKLRTLAYSVMGKKIQEFDERPFIKKSHNPIVDSRIALKLYLKRIDGQAESDTEDHSFDWTRDRISADDKLKQIEFEEKKGPAIEEEEGTKERPRNVSHMKKRQIPQDVMNGSAD